MTWLLYGAYGYTGQLVAEVAAARGERPVLAGRDPARLAAMATGFGWEHRAFDLADPAAAAAALSGFDAVAHCAGPFSATAAPMVDACLEAGTHYLDITGEIDVFEAVLARHADAVAAGVALLPGSGFDVVPSDCLAATLARARPDAIRLDLAFKMGGGLSPGTAKTAVEALGLTARARVGGAIVAVPAERRHRPVPFADGTATATAVSWGDVSTAFHSTGIPDITVYTVLPPGVSAIAAVAAAAGTSNVGRAPIQAALRRVVSRLPGPSPRARAKSVGQLWGSATDADGRAVTGTLTTPNGYALTADAVVRIAGRLAAGAVPPGAHTPSAAFGPDFAAELDGVTVGPVG